MARAGACWSAAAFRMKAGIEFTKISSYFSVHNIHAGSIKFDAKWLKKVVSLS